MLNSIRGEVSEKGLEAVIIGTGALEWEVAMPATDIDSLPAPGEECKVFTWLYHREDQMRLFGFSGEARRNTFLELIKVEGIGPKSALKIMGGIGQDELEKALETGDLARLEAVPGLGKKTAQKMLLALKGKLVSAAEAPPVHSQYSDLVEALAEMGYEKRAAAGAVKKAEAGIPQGLSAAEKEKYLFKNAIVHLSGSNG
ncbi:MAG: Holliday junction branch migration protein RuvA [Treponema sp.]|nr:Holliday junction branch migration protein RuvA [Treponema sp.]